MAYVEGYTGPKRAFTQRMIAAAKLDVPVFEEVEADTTATAQAAGVVAIAAVAHAIGVSGHGIPGALIVVCISLVGWLIWSGLTYLIGAHVFKGTANWGELLRTIGFAHSAGALYFLAFLPVVGWLVEALLGIWILMAGIVAIRQALDITTAKAIFTALIGWAVLIIPMLLLGGAFHWGMRP